VDLVSTVEHPSAVVQDEGDAVAEDVELVRPRAAGHHRAFAADGLEDEVVARQDVGTGATIEHAAVRRVGQDFVALLAVGEASGAGITVHVQHVVAGVAEGRVEQAAPHAAFLEQRAAQRDEVPVRAAEDQVAVADGGQAVAACVAEQDVAPGDARRRLGGDGVIAPAAEHQPERAVRFQDVGVAGARSPGGRDHSG